MSIQIVTSARLTQSSDDHNADVTVDNFSTKDDIKQTALNENDIRSNVASDSKDVINNNGGGRVRRGIINTLTKLHTVGTLLSAGTGQHSTGGMSSLLFADNSVTEAESNKRKPYHFNDVELTAIQALVSIRDVIGELLHRVGINIPAFASLINRSEGDKLKASIPSFLMGSVNSPLAIKSSNAASLLRGLALSLPLLIPMATQLRRMSVDNTPSIPLRNSFPVSSQMLFDPYYNQALHRRRSKRSTKIMPRPLSDSSLEHIVKALEKLEQLYTQQK